MKNSKSSLLRLLRFSFQLSAFSFLFATSSQAATAIWDGAAGAPGNWNADNWSGGGGAGGAPVANDILRFSGNGGTGGPATVNDFGALTQFGNGTGDAIQFTNNGTGGVTNTAFSLSGNSITLGGNITATSSTAAIQDTISNDLLIGATRLVTAAGNHTIALTGNITINTTSGAVLNFNNAAALSGAGGAINMNVTNAAITYSNITTASSLTLSRAINANSGAHLSNTSTDVAATITYSGTFTGTANTFVLNGTNTGANDFQSAIGAGAATILLKAGTGSWTMSGLMSSTAGTGVSGVTGNLTLSNNSNSYTGSTQVTAGTLHIATIADYGTVSNVGKGTSGTALQLGNNASSGILNYTGTGSSSNRTIQIGAGISNATFTGSATIQNNGGNGGTGLKFTATAFNPTIASTTANRTLTLGGTNTDANEIQGVIQNNTASTGLVGVTKAGTGTWTLSGNNTYTGLTTVSGGALNIGSSGSLASGNALTVGASGTANFANASQNLGAVSNDNTATSALNFSNASGTVVLASLTGTGNTRFGSNGTVTGGISTGTVTSVGALNANISGGTITAGGLLTGNITSGTVGAGSLSASSVSGGTNTITGAAGITTLSNGTTTVGGVATIGTMAAGTANLNGATSAITTLNGGSIALGNSTTLTVSNGVTSGAISGGGGLTKSTGGTLTLTGTNTYTGNTTVTLGTLLVNGTLGNGGITVQTGATLGGNITAGGTTSIQSGGTLSVGNSPGSGNFTTLSLAGTNIMEFNSSPSRGSAGIAYDTIGVTTSLIYGGDLKLTFSGTVTNDAGIPFTLFTGAASKSGSFANVYIYAGATQKGSLTNASGVWSGLADLGYGDNQQSFTFTQANGDLIVAVPEPTTWALLAFSLTTVMVLRRRRD